MEYGLNLEQSQKLIITPELKQALSILQLPVLELSEYLQQEATDNPLLEIQEVAEKERAEVSGNEEIDWQEVFANKSDLGLPRGSREVATAYALENYLAQVPTLLEHLSLQFDTLPLTPQEQCIGNYMLGNIDPNGYLQLQLSEVCQKCNCTLTEAESILAKIQKFEPLGVGGRDLVECLLIQVGSRNIANPAVEKIIRYHLQDLAVGKWQKIAKALDIGPKEVQIAADVIKSLNPKPGSNFSNADEPRYIVPDVIVEKIDQEYIVLVNDSMIPRLGINPIYESLLKQRQCDSEALRFIEQKLNSALWLIKSIEQRRLTIYQVVHYILDYQKSFFEKGIKHLKPLTLRQVAEAIGVHESTVSRAASHKYLQAPQGIFELKFFFASGVEKQNGTATSAQSVKLLLQEVVAAEDPQQPYPDEKLAELLTLKGIKISRRTISKYREELGIPNAQKRKRY